MKQFETLITKLLRHNGLGLNVYKIPVEITKPNEFITYQIISIDSGYQTDKIADIENNQLINVYSASKMLVSVNVYGKNSLNVAMRISKSARDATSRNMIYPMTFMINTPEVLDLSFIEQNASIGRHKLDLELMFEYKDIRELYVVNEIEASGMFTNVESNVVVRK